MSGVKDPAMTGRLPTNADLPAAIEAETGANSDAVVSMPESVFRSRLELARSKGRLEAAAGMKPIIEGLIALAERRTPIRDRERLDEWLRSGMALPPDVH